MYIYTLFTYFGYYDSELENIFLDLETATEHAKRLIKEQGEQIMEMLICCDKITEKGRQTIYTKRIKNENWENF